MALCAPVALTKHAHLATNRRADPTHFRCTHMVDLCQLFLHAVSTLRDKRCCRCALRITLTLALCALVALTNVFAVTAQAVVSALDAGELPSVAGALVGLRVLASDMAQRARDHRGAFGPADDEAIDRVFADLATSLSVARGPRMARQARLGSLLLRGA